MRIYGFQKYGGPEVMEHLQVPDPTPGPGQVLIRMHAAGVNPADIKVRDGRVQRRVEAVFPMAMGRESAGEVLDTGPDVAGYEIGDAVFGATAAGTGGLADLVLLNAAGTARIPAGVTAEQATCIPVSVATAHDALDELDLAEGATLLVLGAGGGVGTAACGLGRARGLRVIGVASEGKRPIVEDLGAEHVAKGEGWTDRVRALGGVDAVIDAVGGDVLRDAATLLRVPGAIRSVAAPPTAEELGGFGVTRRRTTQVFSEVAEIIASGQFAPVISGSWPLAQAERAVAAVETGHAAGNVVVVADAERQG